MIVLKKPDVGSNSGRARPCSVHLSMITPVPLPFDLVQIDRLCGPVSCRRFLKKEYLEEVAKQRILANVLRKRLALLSKLRLNGRDENPILHSSDTRQWSAAEMPRTTYIQQVKLYQKARQNGQTLQDWTICYAMRNKSHSILAGSSSRTAAIPFSLNRRSFTCARLSSAASDREPNVLPCPHPHDGSPRKASPNGTEPPVA